MRFSLGALILAVIFAGSLMGIWIRREPWVRDTSMQSDAIAKLLTNEYIERAPLHEFLFVDAKDRRSLAIRKSMGGWTELAIIKDGKRLVTLMQEDWAVKTYAFLDENTLAVTSVARIIPYMDGPSLIINHALYRRRFPEYWWGHLYRFEVWTAILSGVGLIVLGLRRLFSRKHKGAAG